MLVTIQEQLPLVTRQYDNKRTGRPDVFYSKGFVLNDGLNTFYAEAIGALAQRLEAEPLNPSGFVVAEISMIARKYEDKDHNVRYSTDITIQRMANI